MTPALFARWRSRFMDSPWALLVLTMLFWGANAPVVRFAATEISPMAIVTLRWVVVALVIALAPPPDLAAAWPLVRRKPLYLFALSVLMTSSNACIFIAARYTTGVNLSILQGAAPVVVALGAWVAFGSRIRMRAAIGLAISLSGVVLLATGGSPQRLRELGFNIGDLMMLGSVVIYAVYILAWRYRAPVSNYTFFCFVAFASLATSLPMLAWEYWSGGLRLPGLGGFLALIYIAVFTSMLGQIFFMRAVELIGPARSAQFQNLAPVIGAVLSVLFLGESFGLHHFAAMALVIGGILVAERG